MYAFGHKRVKQGHLSMGAFFTNKLTTQLKELIYTRPLFKPKHDILSALDYIVETRQICNKTPQNICYFSQA